MSNSNEHKVTAANKDNVELLLLRYLQLETTGDRNLWEKAEILAGLVKYRPVSWISQRIDRSENHIRNMARTYNVFSNEFMRANDLTFSHHYFIAQKKNVDPYYWIKIAAEEKLKYTDFVKRVNGPKPFGTSTKQVIAELKEKNRQLQEENEKFRQENERLKNILKTIDEEISQVA